jgi:ABC-type uncharacterized transport system auxiliary subunit
MSWRAPITRCAIGAFLLFSACVFHDAPAPHYFAPPSALDAADDPPLNSATLATPVRLLPVRTASYLGEQIAWRVSDVERGLYEERRWTEFPSRYVERAMALALDHTAGIRRVDSGQVATLNLELIAFDEILAPTHEAGVEIVASLRSPDRVPIFQHDFRSQRPIADAQPSSAARAMGLALDDAVTQVAAAVAAQVHPTRASTH